MTAADVYREGLGERGFTAEAGDYGGP